MANPTPRCGYKTLPRMTGFDGHRRTIAPGIYEMTRDASLDGSMPVDKFVNVLQSDQYCYNILHQREKTQLLQCQAKGIKIEIGNVPGNDGEGEDRYVINKVDMNRVKAAHVKLQESGKGTWWGQWHDITQDRDTYRDEADDIVLLSMFDGHGGAHVADLLQKTLHASIAWAIASDPQAAKGAEDAISRILRDSYTSFCQDLANSISAIMHEPAYTKNTEIPGLPSAAQLAIAHFEETGGACAVTAIIYREKVYMTSLGDCRVIGVWNKGDLWEIECPFEDHSGFNPKEVERIRKEHPNDPQAVQPTPAHGPASFYRLRGGLLPTKALGDLGYNRTQLERESLGKELLSVAEYPKGPLVDPPYLSWVPDVVVRDAEDLKFLILSTDGLFDRMTSLEAALGTIARHLSPVQHDIAWPKLPLTIPHKETGIISEHLPGYENGHWSFEDDNAGTHLIRNALCGGDRELFRQMLSLTNGTRRFRDDCTVLVAEMLPPATSNHTG